MRDGLVDISYLHERLRYCEETGKLFWRTHPKMTTFWNTRYGGKEAFTADNGRGYRQGAIDGRPYYAHRIIWALHYGEWPPQDIDHIDHNRSNNRLSNLRAVDRSVNMRNSSRSKANKSGATGVYWNNSRSKWKAEIVVNGKSKSIGCFDSFDDAVIARSKANAEYNFHSNHGI